MTTIAITGAGGLIGRRLVAALEHHPGVERVLGLDLVAPTGMTATKLAVRAIDVRSAELVDALAGADVVVHLAFQVDPLRDVAAMRSINLAGTRNVVEAAARAGVPRLVYTSSVVAYGAHPDNDLPLTESSPLRGTPGFPYAEHKLEVERWLWPWLEDHPELTAAVLRPAVVLGPGVDNFLTRLIEAPRFTAVLGHRPPLQFLHLDDLVAAIVHAIDHGLTGAYNVAAEGWLPFDEVTDLVHRRVLELPEEVAYSTAERLWRAGLTEQPPGMLAHLMHPAVMSSAALIATGWHPQHSNRDALVQTVAEHRTHVVLGRVRTRRSTARLAGLAGALVAGLAVLAAARWVRAGLAGLAGHRRARAARSGRDVTDRL